MSQITYEKKLSETIDKLISGFGFEDNDWKKETFNLLLGSLIIEIRVIKEKKYIKDISKKRKNPELYWEIGKEISDFIVHRKEDIKKFGKTFKINNPYSLIADLIMQAIVEDNKSKWEGFSKKRTFEAAYFLYLLDPDKEFINPDLPWSFYFEFTQQRKLMNLRISEKKLIYSEIVKKRMEKYFSDKDNREILKQILNLEKRNINKTNINHFINKFINERSTKSIFEFDKSKKNLLEHENSLFNQENLSEVINKLDTINKFLYKKLSKNDIDWADPNSGIHQAGLLIPKKTFAEDDFLPITIKKIDENTSQDIFQSEINLLWFDYNNKQIITDSNLKFYRSKNEGRITICPKELFYPDKPEYMILFKNNDDNKYIIYLGKFNDIVFQILEKKFKIEMDLRFKIFG